MKLIRFTIFITPCSFCCSQLCQQPDSCQCFPSERPAPRQALMAGGRAMGEDEDWGNTPLQTSFWQENIQLPQSHFSFCSSPPLHMKPMHGRERLSGRKLCYQSQALWEMGEEQCGRWCLNRCPSGPESCLQSAPASHWVEQPPATAKGPSVFHISSCLVLGSWGLLLNSGPKILICLPILGGKYEFINLISYYYLLMSTEPDSCCQYNFFLFLNSPNFWLHNFWILQGFG